MRRRRSGCAGSVEPAARFDRDAMANRADHVRGHVAQARRPKSVEMPLARQFINAFVTDDATTLDTLGTSIDMKQRASRFLSDYARVDAPIPSARTSAAATRSAPTASTVRQTAPGPPAGASSRPPARSASSCP
jgi:hypothetical protein